MKKRLYTHKKRFNFIIIFAIVGFTLIIYVFYINLDIEKKIMYFNSGINEYTMFNSNLIDPNNIFYMSLNTKMDVKPIRSELNILNSEGSPNEPIVYIYNTHQTEEYNSPMLEAYNISYTTWIASYILQDYLKDLGIESFVENESISNYLNNNKLSYKYSYDASKFYINKRLNEFPTIRYIIDLHRDSLTKDKTTINIGNISYAKILFVVGLDYMGYEYNLNLANRISSNIDSNITKGILKKSGSKVNGIYNQDMKEGALLIEVGGYQNNIMEVSNTLKIFSEALYKEINNG